MFPIILNHYNLSHLHLIFLNPKKKEIRLMNKLFDITLILSLISIPKPQKERSAAARVKPTYGPMYLPTRGAQCPVGAAFPLETANNPR